MKWNNLCQQPHTAVKDVHSNNTYILRIVEKNEGGHSPLVMMRYTLELLTPNGWASLETTTALHDPRNEDANLMRTTECQNSLKRYAAYLYEGDLLP